MENAGRCLPRTTMLKEFFALVSMYEFFIKAHAVAMKINISWTTGPIAPSIDGVWNFTSTQYGVFPICMPTTPIDTTIELATKASQDTPKNATAYLLFIYRATTRKTRRRTVQGRATAYKKLS